MNKILSSTKIISTMPNKRMQFLLPTFLCIFLFCFFNLPILYDFEIHSLWTKILGILFFIISLFSLQDKYKTKANPGISNDVKSEFIFLSCQLLILSYLYLRTLYQHLYSFFLVDFDFIALAEILNNSLMGELFKSTHYGNSVSGNYLSHHFSPTILILAPFLLLSKYRIGYAYGLLFFVILSYLLFAILLIKKKIRGNSFYLTMTLFNINIITSRLFFSYHFELLSIFFFLLFFIGKEFNKNYLTITSFFFLLFLKEDIAIYLFCLGIFFIFEKNFRYAVLISLTSLVYFLFVPSFFQGFLNKSAEVNWLQDWSKWGNSYSEILLNIITNPLRLIETVFLKIKVLKQFLLSFSPVILFYPSIILVSLPIFALHFISDRIWYNTLYNYYSYTVAPFFILGMIFSIHKIKESKYRNFTNSILLVCIGISLYASSGDQSFPYKKIITDPNRVKDVLEITDTIQKNKAVAAQFDLGGFIPRANFLYPLHEKNLDKDYILVDIKRGITPYVDRERIEKMILNIKDKTHFISKEKNGIILFQKYQ